VFQAEAFVAVRRTPAASRALPGEVRGIATLAQVLGSGRGKLPRTVLGRDRPGKMGLHLARAVVPPPRLRAK